MAKRYMGEKDPALDALYEQLDATGRETRADRRTRRQIERQIRKIRAGRLGGIRGLFRGLVDDVGQGLLRQHISQPQIDQFADEIQANIAAEAAGEERPFETPAQDVLGFRTRRSFQPRAEVPETVAVPEIEEIEEIEVTAEKRPEIVEAEPRRGDLTRRSQFPFGVYTGEYAEQFGNEPVQEMLSKLGPNQLRTLERRKRKMAQWPDAFPADYATPEGLRKYAKGKKVKKSKKSKAIGEEGWLFDPSDPVDVGLMGLSAIPIGGRAVAGAGLAGKAGIKALMKAMQRSKDFRRSNFIRDNIARDIQSAKNRLPLLALSGFDVDGMNPEIQALIEAEQAGGYAQGGTLTGQADRLSRAGRGDDTMLMHVTPEEVQGLASLAPGMMTINPETGLPEAGLFGDILGFAAPFLGSLVGIPPWAMSAAITAMKGGDLKDMAISGGISALGTKAFEGMADTGNVENLLSDPATFDPSGVSITGAVPEHVQALAGTSGSIPITIPSAVPGSLSNIPSTMGVDALTKAGLGSNLLAQGTAGADPMTFLETAGATPKQLGIFKETFAANNPFDWKGATPSDRWGAVKGGGFGGVKDAIFTPEGISFTALKSLELQNEGQEAFEDYLLAMEEQRKQRERDIEAYYPENFPIDALAASGGAVGGYAGGGSIYKDRYINGNWS